MKGHGGKGQRDFFCLVGCVPVNCSRISNFKSENILNVMIESNDFILTKLESKEVSWWFLIEEKGLLGLVAMKGVG